MSSCSVLKPGLFTTIQDQGRPGYRAYGMPLAGAMDRFAYTLANVLVGSPQGAAVLEMTLQGGSFLFQEDAFVSVCGADMQGRLDGRKIRMWSSLVVKSGSELSFGYAEEGCRAYLAFSGGIDVETVLGSRSTYARATVGGYKGRALRTGDVLTFGRTGVPKKSRSLSQRFLPRYDKEVSLRIMPGPQDEYFTAAGIETFFNNSYRVTARNDRMGYLLEGPGIERAKSDEMISDALCPGAVQVPGSGMPIVMMTDCQTVGGYPKIGTVISSDLSKLAQTKTGDTVRFVLCSDVEAVAALQQEQALYAEYSAILSLFAE